MSWKEDMVSQLGILEKMVKVMVGQTALNSKRIEAMRVMIEQSDRTRSRAADRMADRIIEMAMVNQGKTAEAAGHRRALNEETETVGDPWQDTAETQWPPVGCDAIDM